MNNMKNYTFKLESSISYFKTLSYPGMSIKEQTFFVKKLSFLIKAGIPILDSLIIIKDQTKKKGYLNILNKIILDVSNGQSLSNSLAKFPQMFSEFSVNIIRFGESNGILSENLEYLALELKKNQLLRKKVIGAFIYPVVVVFATFGITGFLMIYLFPKIIPVFQSLKMELPISTKLVIFLSNYIRFNGVYLFLGLVFFVFSFILLLKKSHDFRFYFDKVILKIPVIGNIVKDYNLANSTRTIGLLLKGGVTVSDAIFIAEKTCSNLVYKEEFKKLSESVNRGDKISSYLNSRTDLFPNVLSQIISVGERSGNLSNSLAYLSELYETQVDDFTKNISGLIEPALMVLMGLLVGFIAISIITPIYSITQNIHG